MILNKSYFPRIKKEHELSMITLHCLKVFASKFFEYMEQSFVEIPFCLNVI